jgi:hypothetical protein
MPKGRVANTLNEFWNYVSKGKASVCWLWKGPIHYSGYGTFNCNKHPYQAHRVAYFLNFGGIELNASRDKSDRTFVLHSCDTRACCNPAHLFLGSIADNTRDMVGKKRHRTPLGELHGKAKLTNAQVKAIRYLCKKKLVPQSAIAKTFGVTQTCINNVHLRKTYRCVDGS